eukprot:124457_1
MGNASNYKEANTIHDEKKEKLQWNMLKHVPRSDYSQPVLLNDCNIIFVPKNIGHTDNHRYVILYDSKRDKYNAKWIKISGDCKLYQNICFSNDDKSKVYVLGGRFYCFLQIDIKKKKIIEYIKDDLQQYETSEMYNYQHTGEYPMICSEPNTIANNNSVIHIVGGSESSKHLKFEFDTNTKQPQFKTLCQSLFNGDKDASYCEGGMVFNELSGNLITFGGKRNNDFLKRIWITQKTNDSAVVWRRSRGNDLPQKIHLFGYILISQKNTQIVVIFGGKTHDGNNSNAIFYCKLKKHDDAISFQKLKYLTCPFSGQCFAVLDDTNYKIHLFRQKYHYSISSQLLTKIINEQKEEKAQVFVETKQENEDIILVKNPLVILLGIKTYEQSTKLQDLVGTESDIEAYKNCFENEYNYKVICQDKFQWIGDEIKHFFISARKHLVDPKNDTKGLHDGLIVVIAGHGHKDVFIQSDGISRGINYYHAFFSRVWSDIISSLKIRLFIIDCCRGDIRSGAIKYHESNDPFDIKSTRGTNEQHVDNLLVSIYGNSPGHQVKEDEFGGLFSQSLVDALKQKEAKLPLNRLLKRVKADLNDDSNHSQLVTTEGDQSALFCVLTPNS